MINTWFKLRHIVSPQHPKVGKMARALGCNRMTAYGVACAWFRYVDMFTTDGYTNLTPDELDEELGFRGCTDALSLVVWAALDESGCVMAPHFDEHCGETAKKRAMNSRYQENTRGKKKILQHDDTLSEKNLTPYCTPVRKKSYQSREEKNRVDIEEEEEEKEEEEITLRQSELNFSSPISSSIPASIEEVYTFLSSLSLPLPDSELRSCAEKFFLGGQSTGWKRGNTPVSDWRASSRLYSSRWVENYQKRIQTRSGSSLNANIYA